MIKKIKQIFIHLSAAGLLPIVLLFSVACAHYETAGLEKFAPELSEDGLTGHLIPDDLLEVYPYVDGDFYYYLDEVLLSVDKSQCEEKCLLWLEYSDEIYLEAKEYILLEMDLDLEQELSYSGYTFYINYGMKHVGHYPCSFPGYYNAAGFSDANHRLIFIGFHATLDDHPEIDYGLTDFGLYLETFFGEYYNFNDVAE